MNRFLTLVLFISLAFSFEARAQLSPGDLTQAHKQLEGINNCTQCHDVGHKITNDKCLNCHKEIEGLITAKKGYHGSTVVGQNQCVKCHSEHHGRDFDLTRFNRNTFNHNLTGYKLEDKHAQADCRKCHQSKNIENTELQKRDSTFLGLKENCQSCHVDYHQKTLSDKCQTCHTNFKSFRPANGFNHDNAAYKLDGAHVKTDCKKCHKPTQLNGKDFQAFKGIGFSTCNTCHADVHKGKLGLNCIECHTTTSFTELRSKSKFNHNATAYPLIGKHQNVDCKKCHTKAYTQPIKHDRCNDCHTDYHKGDFVTQNKKPDCKQCHAIEQPFTYSNYSIDDHNKSDYALTGSHMATPCFSCHKPNERWSFNNMGSKCSDCHKNSHTGIMSTKFLTLETCNNCHNTEVWSKVNFDHTKTNWNLKGKHAEATCRQCHYKVEEKTKQPMQQFATLGTQCTTCHKSIHGNEFIKAETETCTQCHSDQKPWNQVTFNHSTTKFILDGAHEKVSCTKCHKYQPLATNSKILQFKMESFKCIDCHY